MFFVCCDETVACRDETDAVIAVMKLMLCTILCVRCFDETDAVYDALMKMMLCTMLW